jgi:hypothetical protein
MTEQESINATALELISYARERCVDLVPRLVAETFWNDESDRSIVFRRQNDVIIYLLSGRVTALPKAELTNPGVASDFAGAYGENGAVEDIEGAFQLLTAWLLDRKEVDDLPKRISGRLGRIC